MSRVTKCPSLAAPARILVVDDQDSIRDFTRAMLAKVGYEVATAINGAEAVAAVRDLPFDLVLMDVHMPVMDGLAAARQIRLLDGSRSKVPIIALSVNVPGLAAAGVDDHLGKPFRKVELFRKIDQWLDRSAGSHWLRPTVPVSGGGIFNEACELMGRPWAIDALKKLVTQIDDVFGVGPEVTIDEGRLARQAHGLVSLAALLGFAGLSELCGALEEACGNPLGAAPAFEDASAAALSARATALALIARRARDGGSA
jgi:CheY-like chemotaxis protein/HPt (histidine-containing phosphotransfer) domain-containing protein